MGCSFCGHSTPHGCRDAHDAASCGNFANARAHLKEQWDRVAEVEREIAKRSRGPTESEIAKAERRELARLKAKYKDQ